MNGARLEYWIGEFCEAVGKSAKHNCQSHIIFEIKSLYDEARKEVLQERDKYKKALEEINKKCNRSEPMTYTEFDRLFDEIDMITKEVLTK